MRSGPDWSAPTEPPVSRRRDAVAGLPRRGTVRWTLLVATVACVFSVRAATVDIPIERLRPDSSSYTLASTLEAAEQFVVRDPESWRALWARVHGRSRPAPPLPAMDFEREMVAVAALGRQRSGGYSVRIERAYREGSTTIIVVRQEQPGRGCIVPSSLTYPVDLARLPFNPGPVTFRIDVVTQDCG